MSGLGDYEGPVRRTGDDLHLHILSEVSGLKATVLGTQALVAQGAAATTAAIESTKAVLVEKIEGGDRDQATAYRFVNQRVDNVERDVVELAKEVKPRITKLESWQGRMAGALALIVVLIPVLVVVLQHVWHQ